MKITFFGATRSVSGSKYLVENKRSKVLVDCGLFQGAKDLRRKNWSEFPITPHSIHTILLTHAHIDHSGYIPRLVKEGFKGKILSTPATRDLCKILLPDAGYLQEEEARYANRRGYSKHRPALPLFTVEEAFDALKLFRTVDYGREFDLGDNLKVLFRNSGHILGSANITISNGESSVCFSGDIGRSSDPILLPCNFPEEVDNLVIESTYGDRIHPQISPQDQISDAITRTVERQGTIVIPAFSVGRTQNILYYISELRREKRIPLTPIYLDSPMAINATKLYNDYQALHKLSSRQCEEMFSIATYINSPEESKRLNKDKTPKIIISASGMATGGRVIHHIRNLGPNPLNTILFTGFQAAGTRGEKLVNGAKTLRMFGQDVPIGAEVINVLSLSAHADQEGLLAVVERMKNLPRQVFITHGEEDASLGFKRILEQKLNLKCIIPDFASEYEL